MQGRLFFRENASSKVDALSVHRHRRRLRTLTEVCPHFFAQMPKNQSDRAVLLLLFEIVENRLPRRALLAQFRDSVPVEVIFRTALDT